MAIQGLNARGCALIDHKHLLIFQENSRFHTSMFGCA